MPLLVGLPPLGVGESSVVVAGVRGVEEAALMAAMSIEPFGDGSGSVRGAAEVAFEGGRDVRGLCGEGQLVYLRPPRPHG